LGIEVRPVAAARDAIAEADIVALATNANEKVLEAAWIEPGQHVSSDAFSSSILDCTKTAIEWW
jgi:ornithine cyclodeaminase/alanine dehydrogenase-like protein (mu-crystallin family)